MKRSGTVANKQKEDKDAKYYWVPDVKEVWLPGMLMEDKGQRIRVLIGPFSCKLCMKAIILCSVVLYV